MTMLRYYILTHECRDGSTSYLIRVKSKKKLRRKPSKGLVKVLERKLELDYDPDAWDESLELEYVDIKKVPAFII